MPKTGKALLVIFSLAGALIMGYLVKLHFSSETGGAFCNLGEGLSCDIVNKSEYSTILGVPLSILGFLYFLGVLALVFFKNQKLALKHIVIFSIAFLGPSLYLSYIEFFVINNVCVFCEISKALMVAIIITAFISLSPEKISKDLVIGAVLLGVVLGGITYLAQSKSGPGDTYDEFAQCLNQKGFKVYGSITCAYCARQRAMFGSAFQYIKELECDPRNNGPEEEYKRCIAKNIEQTPTWIQEDEAGNELYRFDAGVQSFEKLSEASGCALPN